jgi:iron complex transport system permease protein
MKAVETTLENIGYQPEHKFWCARNIMLMVLPVIFFFFSFCVGRYWVQPDKVFKILMSQFTDIAHTWTAMEETIVLKLRFPRIVMTMLVGAGLSVSGASFQGLFGNPLVSPHILGVSAGAGFGAALAIMLSGTTWLIQVLSIVFGVLAVLITCSISRIKKSGASSIYMLVLSGVIAAAFFEALISTLKYVADPFDKLPTIVYWLMGSMAGITQRDILVGGPMILIGITILVLMRWRMNVLSLDEEEARSLGINIKQSRMLIILACTLVTAAAVSMCGIVGWVGLVIPHVGRIIVGPNHKDLIPASAFIGALYLLFIDGVARAATSTEIPLSILTAIIGAPFFAYLLRKSGGQWS